MRLDLELIKRAPKMPQKLGRSRVLAVDAFDGGKIHKTEELPNEDCPQNTIRLVQPKD